LNGHAVRGANTVDRYGVGSVGGTRTRVTIRHGSISGFERGVFFDALDGGTLEGLALDDAQAIMIAGRDSVVAGNTVDTTGTAIDVRGRGSTIRANEVRGAPAILAEADARIIGNRVRGNVRFSHHGGGRSGRISSTPVGSRSSWTLPAAGRP
jgi:hypothetical protein